MFGKKRLSQIELSGSKMDSNCYLGLGDVLDEFLSEPGPLLNLISHLVHGSTAGGQSTDLLHGGLIHGEVLIQILSVAPNVSFQQLNAWMALDMVLR